MLLDCSSIDSTIASLERIFRLNAQTIRAVVANYNPDEYKASHPADTRWLWEILPEVLCCHGGMLRNPDTAYWFHGTRVLHPERLKEIGLRTLHQHIDQIWTDLFQFAGQWINQQEWDTFRNGVETTDSHESSERYRRRLANLSDTGPHAVLVRESLLDNERFASCNYLEEPESIADICESFMHHYRHDLLGMFHSHSVSCIVKFIAPCDRPALVGKALSYVWCTIHSEPCVTCNTCFESNGNPVLPAAIESIEIVTV